MAVQQRILGTAFLVFGLAVVVILIVTLTGGGPSATEARAQLLELHGKLEEATKTNDYLAQKNVAQEMLDLVQSTGKATVNRDLGANLDNRAVRRLKDLLESERLQKNAEGLYAFESGWYSGRSHRSLRAISEAIEGPLRRLFDRRKAGSVRWVAEKVGQLLQEAREGSKLPLALPEPVADAGEDFILKRDQALFLALRLPGDKLEAALSTKDPGGGAYQARVRWNKAEHRARREQVAGHLEQLSGFADDMVSAANTIERNLRELANRKEAEPAVQSLLRKGATLGAPEVSAEERAPYEDPVALVRLIRAEAELLRKQLASTHSLAGALRRDFKMN